MDEDEEKKSRKEIAERILKEYGIKKKEIAELIGASPAFVTLILKGKRNLPLEKAELLLRKGIPISLVKVLVNPKYERIVEKLGENLD